VATFACVAEKVVQVTRRGGNNQPPVMIVAAWAIVFCCGCWGLDIKKSPRCVGRQSAVENNCFTSNYHTI